MPQIFNTFEIARPAYYDRNPVPVCARASRAAGPFGFTLLASYAPAYPYAAFIEIGSSAQYRVTAAGVLGVSIVEILYTGFTAATAVVLVDYFSDNVVNHAQARQVAQFGYMAYGDKIEIFGSCTDTGGVIAIEADMKGVEFQY